MSKLGVEHKVYIKDMFLRFKFHRQKDSNDISQSIFASLLKEFKSISSHANVRFRYEEVNSIYKDFMLEQDELEG